MHPRASLAPQTLQLIQALTPVAIAQAEAKVADLEVLAEAQTVDSTEAGLVASEAAHTIVSRVGPVGTSTATDGRRSRCLRSKTVPTA